MKTKTNFYGQKVAYCDDVWMRVVDFINGTSVCRVEVMIGGEWMYYHGDLSDCDAFFTEMVKGV